MATVTPTPASTSTSAPTSTPASVSPASIEARIVKDLMNPQTVRNDIAFALGAVGAVASLLGHKLGLPAVPDAVIGAGGLLLALGARLVGTFVHGGLSKSALENDVKTALGDLPSVKADLAVIKPFLSTTIPGFQSVVTVAAKDAAEAKAVALSVQNQVSNLPSAQQAAIESLLVRLQGAATATAATTSASTTPA